MAITSRVVRILVVAATLGVFSLPPASAAAQRAERAPSAFDVPPRRVAVLTMGPGDHPFARFGHNALLLEWRDRALVYNFGTFAFDGLSGIRDFMAGRFRYWLSVSTLPDTLYAYAAQNRTVVAQELALTREERGALAKALAENARPENRYYDYDYYYDNCTTRVRDAIDRVLGGELARAVEGPGRYTFREHTERLSAEELWLYTALDLALGPLTDRPTTRWDELWIPDELERALDRATIDRDGERRPIVARTRTLVTAERPPALDAPPARVPGFALTGLAFGGALALLGGAARARPALRAAFGALTALIGLLLGFIGWVLLYFWLFTKHWAAHQNMNLLLTGPWAVALSATGIGLALGRTRGLERSRRLLAVSAVCALLAVVLALIPGFGQDNTRMAALFAPIWLGLYAGARLLSGMPLAPRRPTPPAKEPTSSEKPASERNAELT
ncbi:MAG TPA: DUF4105 domain-containing protein [Polyangiaceae bacterium]|nr:DUF4105 domain-containing protein [Polyangiaceae bacterium]